MAATSVRSWSAEAESSPNAWSTSAARAAGNIAMPPVTVATG